ncbi:MAG TPA: YlbD family protein [Bacillales bacterium]|nr:YlbD family protein [Bacillales bacterium]
MASEKLEKFKTFVRKHPKLAEEVRNENRTWQQIYEEWVIFGEDHEIWDPYLPEKRNEPRTREQANKLADVMSVIKKIDFNDLQHYIDEFSGVLTNVQKVMESFQGGNGGAASQSDTNTGGSSDARGQQPYPYGPYPPPQGPYQPFPYHQPR